MAIVSDMRELKLTARFQFVGEPEIMERVEDWRSEQRPIPNLSEALRRLVISGLDAEAAKKKGSKK